jgi:hypothetical protein
MLVNPVGYSRPCGRLSLNSWYHIQLITACSHQDLSIAKTIITDTASLPALLNRNEEVVRYRLVWKRVYHDSYISVQDITALLILLKRDYDVVATNDLTPQASLWMQMCERFIEAGSDYYSQADMVIF